MRDDFTSYPEIIFLDATYKLTELRLPVYIFMVEDSMGLSEVVGVALLVNESKETMEWLIDSFKKNNDTKGLRVVMADKDITERNVIKERLNVPVLICLFHALKAFKREMATLKLPTCDSGNAKELFQKMCYSKTAVEYTEHLQKFKELNNEPLQKYFREHWEHISSDWVRCLKSQYGNFLNSTNNRLESFNSKLKSVINHHSSLETFIKSFFIVLKTLRNERDHVIASEFQKQKVSLKDSTDTETNINCALTSYAAKYVVKQLSASEQINTDSFQNIENIEYETKSGNLSLTRSTCSCCFSTSMRLPCRHIFAFRSFLNLPVFDVTLCDTRWLKQYCHQTQRVFKPTKSVSDSSFNIIHSPCRSDKKLNQNERFRKANQTCIKLASLASEVGGGLYGRRLETLQLLQQFWERNEEVCITQLPNCGKKFYPFAIYFR